MENEEEGESGFYNIKQQAQAGQKFSISIVGFTALKVGKIAQHVGDYKER